MSIATLYAGHIDRAAAIVEESVAIAPDDPRVHLFRFRVRRESFPDDIHEEERAKAEAPGLIAPLDLAIARCNARLSADPASVAAHLYRGWAHMMKAQVYALARQIGPAAEASNRGRDDLELVLRQPGAPDPDAQVIMGGYLYFAATLPAIVKLLQWLSLVPPGDAPGGLEMMRRGCRGGGYASLDGELVLGVTLYLFEGDVEEARAIFDRLASVHPRNPRLAELRASLAMLYPARMPEAVVDLTSVIAAWGRDITGWDPSLLYRLQWSRARLLWQIGRYDEARDGLGRLVDEAPPYPPWMTPQALLGLAMLERNLGLMDEARQDAERLLAERRYRDYHERARRLVRHEPSAEELALFRDLGAVRRTLFAGENGTPSAGSGAQAGEPSSVASSDRLDRCRELLDRLSPPAARDPRARFVVGELELAAGRLDEALVAFAEVAGRGAGGSSEDIESLLAPLRLMALVRSAEIDIARGDCAAAESAYRRARDLEPRATMLGRILRGRLHYLDDCRGATRSTRGAPPGGER